MSINSLDDIQRPKMPFFRNALMAALLMTNLGNIGNANAAAPSALKDNDEITNPSKSGGNGPEKEKCTMTGALTLDGEDMKIQILCLQNNKITTRDIVINADKSGKYNIPLSKGAYFFINEGEPAISFVKDGQRVTGMMSKEVDGTFSFENYLDHL